MPNPRFSRSAVPLFLLAAFAGCASYAPRPLSPQATAAAFEARSLSDPRLAKYVQAHLPRTEPAALSSTWDLDKLTLAALYYHPDLGVARAQQNVAEAGVQVSRQRPNPILGFTPEYNFDAVSGMSPWILGWVLNFPIETAGRRSDRETLANDQRAAARFHVAEVAWQAQKPGAQPPPRLRFRAARTGPPQANTGSKRKSVACHAAPPRGRRGGATRVGCCTGNTGRCPPAIEQGAWPRRCSAGGAGRGGGRAGGGARQREVFPSTRSTSRFPQRKSRHRRCAAQR